MIDPPILVFSLHSKTYLISKSTASTKKILNVLSASFSLFAGAGTVLG